MADLPQFGNLKLAVQSPLENQMEQNAEQLLQADAASQSFILDTIRKQIGLLKHGGSLRIEFLARYYAKLRLLQPSISNEDSKILLQNIIQGWQEMLFTARDRLQNKLEFYAGQVPQVNAPAQLAALELISQRIDVLRKCVCLPLEFLRSYCTKLHSLLPSVADVNNKDLLQNAIEGCQNIVFAAGERGNALAVKFMLEVHDYDIKEANNTLFVLNEKVLANDEKKAKQIKERESRGPKHKRGFIMKQFIKRKWVAQRKNKKKRILRMADKILMWVVYALLDAPALPVRKSSDMDAVQLLIDHGKFFKGTVSLIKPSLEEEQFRAATIICERQQYKWQVIEVHPDTASNILELGLLDLKVESKMIHPKYNITRNARHNRLVLSRKAT